MLTLSTSFQRTPDSNFKSDKSFFASIQLISWYEELPPELRINLKRHKEAAALPALIMAHLAFRWLLILLHRPFFRRQTGTEVDLSYKVITPETHVRKAILTAFASPALHRRSSRDPYASVCLASALWSRITSLRAYNSRADRVRRWYCLSPRRSTCCNRPCTSTACTHRGHGQCGRSCECAKGGWNVMGQC